MERRQAYSHWLSVDGCSTTFVSQNTATLKLQANNCIAAKEQIPYDVRQGVRERGGGGRKGGDLNTELFLIQK